MTLKLKRILLPVLLMLAGSLAFAGEIDRRIESDLARRGVKPSSEADAALLVRRYFLVVTDRIPTEAQTKAFLKNPDRTALVDSLLASDGFAGKLVLKWGDLLRIKSEFPSCMWPNAVQAFNKWLLEEFRANTPYDQFVRELLSGTGSNFRCPQTNFYRAGSDRTPRKFASDAALLFLGRREAPEEWQPFFSQIKFKSTKEWKEEILCLDVDVLPPELPIKLGDKSVTLEDGTDYRVPFVNWLASADNRDFAMAFANRLWFWLMGRGIIHPVDDLANAGAPSNPGLLDYLTDRFISSGFDVRALAREILLSDAFARSTIYEEPCDDALFAHYIQSRLTAEQICDALCDITGVPDKYSSRAPEPFTNFPAGTRAVEVCDGTITTPQLDIFGRPSRDVPLESGRDNTVNSKQILYLLNSTDIQSKLRKSPWLRNFQWNGNIESITGQVYMRVLSRPATPEEVKAVSRWYDGVKNSGVSYRTLAESLVWALLNTDEFLFLN
ncbi:MAG: DUF1553 domain-containing protein [Bacteroidales bacterium]|nr:DUF1553 domain-containing protein [Bacteroidales bacterium]